MVTTKMKVGGKEAAPQPCFPEAADRLLSELVRDEPKETPREKEQSDLEEVRRDPGAHITSAVVRLLLRGENLTETAPIVLPHLGTCSWCRNTLEEALRLYDAEETHPAHALLQEADEWMRWNKAGEAATDTARQFLKENGGNVIYGCGGVVYAERPDGTVEAVSSAEEPSAR